MKKRTHQMWSCAATVALCALGALVLVQRAWALPNCNPPLVIGCRDDTGICSGATWNFNDSALAGWQCQGSVVKNYKCIQQVDPGCCPGNAPAQCTVGVCPCPY
jgi:hypothetical protein